MINLAAIGSVKNWPTIAEYGFSSIFYYLLAALIFFIPTALVSAELATGWPKIGGVFVWVKEAFGHRWGFLAIWLLWIENVIWYPTMLSFIAATVAYIFNPELASNKTYLLLSSLSAFWIMTLINLKGMKISGWISSFGMIFGTFLPAAVIIGLGFLWYFSGSPLQIEFNLDSFVPNLSSPEQLVIFTGILLSFCGMEMSAIHARDVQNPQRNYPPRDLALRPVDLRFNYPWGSRHCCRHPSKRDQPDRRFHAGFCLVCQRLQPGLARSLHGLSCRDWRFGFAQHLDRRP
jgi:amino acid transporter